MSRLKIYWPTDCLVPESTVASARTRDGNVEFRAALDFAGAESPTPGLDSGEDGGGGEPDILPFDVHARRIRSMPQFEVTRRARLLHRNSTCPHCRSIRVAPLLQEDGYEHLSSHVFRLAALVAFQCERCHAKWPA